MQSVSHPIHRGTVRGILQVSPSHAWSGGRPMPLASVHRGRPFFFFFFFPRVHTTMKTRPSPAQPQTRTQACRMVPHTPLGRPAMPRHRELTGTRTRLTSARALARCHGHCDATSARALARCHGHLERGAPSGAHDGAHDGAHSLAAASSLFVAALAVATASAVSRDTTTTRPERTRRFSILVDRHWSLCPFDIRIRCPKWQ